MELRPGYKQTEVGVIPQGWEVKTFEEYFNISAGGDVNPRLSSAEQDDVYRYPIYSNALTNQGLYGYCSYADHPADSITVTARGTLGVATYRDHEYTAIGRVLILEPKERSAGLFFAEFINIRVEFALESTGVPQLTAPQIGRYHMAVPPYSEQCAIAEAFCDFDALLSELGRLIAKKTELKQAAVQQLLTGQTRLPGFTGDWRIWSLDQIAARAAGVWGADKPDKLRHQIAKVIRAGDISQNGMLIGTATRFLSESEFDKAMCRFDDLVLTASGNGLGKVWWCDGRPHIVASNFVKVLRPDGKLVNGKFLSYALRTVEGLRQLQEHTATSAYPNLRPTFFSTSWIALPDVAEQEAIVEVLTDVDAELTSLERRRDKIRKLKRGIMQELLSGRTRLV